MNVNTHFAHAAIDQSVSVLRTAATTRLQTVSMLDTLESKLTGILMGAKPLTDFQDARYRAMLTNVKEATNETFAKVAGITDKAMEAVARSEAAALAGASKQIVGVDIFSATLPTKWAADVRENSLIQGATNAEWWNRQNADLQFRFQSEVRQGIVANETNAQIVARVQGIEGAPGVLFKTKAQAEALVRTAVQTSANEARMDVFRRNSDVIKGVQQISTLDERTTEICMAYDGEAWDLDGEPLEGSSLPFDGGPPRHWNCRSVLIPVTKDWDELGVDIKDDIDEGTRASMDGQLAKDTTFDQWINAQSVERQDAILGLANAEKFRAGNLSVKDFVTAVERPVTSPMLPVEWFGTPSAAFKETVSTVLEAIPANVMQRMIADGQSVQAGERLIDIRPDLKGVRPRGWPSGLTWEHAEGLHDQTDKAVLVTETKKVMYGKGYETSERAAGVLWHEFGHGVDQAYDFASSTPEFIKAYVTDVSKLSGMDRKALSYYLQEGKAGRQETFAESFGWIHGHIGAGITNMENHFPLTTALMRKILS